MSVLKDASATAIYGSRGANGVIIITTKSGKEGGKQAPVVHMHAEYGVQQLQKRIDLLNGQEFARVVNVINPGTFNNISKVANTDWQKEIYQNFVPVQNYNLSINGGTDKYSYFFSAGYYGQQGIINKSDFERLTLRLNNSYQITDHIKVGANLTASPESRNNAANVVPMAYRAWPTSVPYAADTLTEVRGAGNPIAAIDFNNSYSKRLHMIGDFYGTVNFLKMFTFKSSFGFDLSNNRDKSFTPAYYISSSQSNALSSLSVGYGEFHNWLWENTLTFDKEVKKHHFNFLAGFTAQRDNSQSITAGTKDLLGNDPALWYIMAGTQNYNTVGDGAEITAIESYLFRLNYTFSNRYSFTGTFRRDGSSKFGINNVWANFPSLAVAWNIRNEKFMQWAGSIDVLKLRGSWGVTGNQEIPWYKKFSLVQNDLNAIFGQAEKLVPGTSYGVLGNPDLKWESTYQTDIGIELGMFNSKLTAEFDYYNKTTEGILVDLLTGGHMGNGPYATVTFNAAKLTNQGFEMNIGWVETRGDFTYRLRVTGSALKNKVLGLGSSTGANSFIPNGPLGNGQLVTRTVVGQQIGEFYGYKVIGVFQNEAELSSSAKIDGQQVGDLKYADLNKDGLIDDKDRTYLGSYIPKVTYSLSADFSYKGFDLSLDLYGQAGNKIYNGKNAVRPDLYNFEGRVRNYWHGEGTSNTEPRPTAGGVNYEPSDYFIENGSFLRLRNVNLGYTLPDKFLAKLKISKTRVFINGTNLYTLTKYSGYTPEIASSNALGSGIDMGVYPITAIYSIGVDITF